jgi:hypothetical protein
MVNPTAEVADAEFERVCLLEDLVLKISPNQFIDFFVFWSSPKLLSFDQPTAAQNKRLCNPRSQKLRFCKAFKGPRA